MFFWGRETLPMQPILLGVLIGLSWKDPENLGWNRAASVAYFASAGAMSMCLWAIMKAYVKKKGLVMQLPGESEPPPGGMLPYDSLAPPAVDPTGTRFEEPDEADVITGPILLAPSRVNTLFEPPPKITTQSIPPKSKK